jgi:hypothetical protein
MLLCCVFVDQCEPGQFSSVIFSILEGLRVGAGVYISFATFLLVMTHAENRELRSRK